MADAAALFKAGFFLARPADSCYDGRNFAPWEDTVMNQRELNELRRRFKPDRTAISKVYGCYVSSSRQIISYVDAPLGLLFQEEQEMYLNLLKKSLSGTLGRNLIDIEFSTRQVADSDEHRLLQTLRQTELQDPNARESLYRRIIDAIDMGESSYLILLAADTYDVPHRSRDDQEVPDGSDTVFRYFVCTICPVKDPTLALQYSDQDKEFRGSSTGHIAQPPVLGFLFPAFDDRSTNIYNALYYNHSPKENYETFVDTVFHTPVPKPAFEQKQSFEALLGDSLGEACSMEVVQAVQSELVQQIELHKESKVPEPLLINKEQVKEVLTGCGIEEDKLAKFSVEFDEAFGFDAEVHPKNIIDNKRMAIRTPDVTIQVDPAKADLVETRVIGGVKYLLINAEENVEVNGVNIHIGE